MSRDNKSCGPERRLSRGVTRRRALQVGGFAGVVALAGCAGSAPENESGETTGGGGGGAGGNGGGTDGGETTDSETEQEQARAGGSLTVAQAGAPPDWDPVKGLGVPSAIVGQNVFSSLYTYNDALELIPSDLGDGLPEPEREGQRWVVSIVDNATFHNGDPVTAEDIMYSFQAPIDEGS
ncbi:ABC transporter substrate-binding protein, partial [Halomarina oriensis]|nr:ABC transporter substrate-binding protein [Halomarina oriensis]